ncbi:hypothetical protein [Ferruginivarius sediminum]|uniref:hypothetical protein n=1 Tax=Ferruginivarius sediminum TaxID=2661937 RepID=UPI0011C082DE|nr:hypothetical protein [Ferruginivarius sediminum]
MAMFPSKHRNNIELSANEVRLLRGVLNGRSIPQIADCLNVPPEEVEARLQALLHTKIHSGNLERAAPPTGVETGALPREETEDKPGIAEFAVEVDGEIVAWLTPCDGGFIFRSADSRTMPLDRLKFVEADGAQRAARRLIRGG